MTKSERKRLLEKAIAKIDELIALEEKKLGLYRQQKKGLEYELKKLES